MKRIAVTGSAGQIAYSLLFRLAAGELYGPKQPISLSLLELPHSLEALKGVVMELEDCAYPLLQEVRMTSDPDEAFDAVDIAFLIGAKPRGPGMERKELLLENSKIFIEQGKALSNRASRSVKVLVVGNPCNTNALLAMHYAPKLDRGQFFAMTRLDQNRATALLAHKAHVPITSVHNVVIWGNHSSTQVPDFFHAKIHNLPVTHVIADHQWLEKEFISHVQQRGAAVIAARGKSSAASAAHAALETMRSLLEPTQSEKWFSVALLSTGNPYGIREGLFFSFPCYCNPDGEVKIISGLSLNAFLKEKIALSEAELIEERSLIKHLL